MLSHRAARRFAYAWKAMDTSSWPAERIFPRSKLTRSGLRLVELGYENLAGDFVEVVELVFMDSEEPVYVDDRRRRKDRWPQERTAYERVQSEMEAPA